MILQTNNSLSINDRLEITLLPSSRTKPHSSVVLLFTILFTSESLEPVDLGEHLVDMEFLSLIAIVVFVLLLALDLKLVGDGGFLATLDIFVNGVENACRSGCAARSGTSTAGCDGHEVGQGGFEGAALAATAAAELLAGRGSGGCGLFAGLELEEGLLL
jgi:hypothetical protein